MALQFPDKSGEGENPLVDINNEDNGVTYYWDPASNSWVLVTAQTVTKDYVDGRDQLRYRRDGTDFIYGDFIIRKQSDFAVDPTVVITTSGTLKLSDDNKITFSSKQSDNLPTLSYGEIGNEVPVIVFNSSFIYPQKPFLFNTDDVSSDRVFLIENEGVGIIKLFDIQHASGVSYSKNVVKIPNDKNSVFAVSSDDAVNVGLFVKGNNETEVVSNSSASFVVRNTGTTAKEKYPFTVDTLNHKIYTSVEYSNALKSGSGSVSGPSGNTFYNFKEENLVATKGYVDAQTREEPGYNVCADREDDAQSGGFWRNGSTLYWKL